MHDFWNLGHFFYFAILAFVCDAFFRTKLSAVSRSLYILSALSCIGLGIEIIQLSLDGRNFSWSDVARDVAGGLVALLLCNFRKYQPFQTVLSGCLLLVIVFFTFFPFGRSLLDEYRSNRDFPLLAGFESALALSRWGEAEERLERVSVPRIEGNFSAKLALTTEQYSGVSLNYFPGDWRGWNRLVFNVYNPGQPVVLHYRVHDQFHFGKAQSYSNRYNGRTLLEYGWNEITIPVADILAGPRGRKMDLAKIKGFGIFVVKQAEPRVLYLDNIRLL